MNENIIAITIGDIEGIGIELLIENWKNKINNNIVIFSNNKILQKYLLKKKN